MTAPIRGTVDWGQRGVIFTLTYPGLGVMTYEAHSHRVGGASVNYHSVEDPTGYTSRSSAPCDFLSGGEPCYFDGTSLGPELDDENEIYALLAAWAPWRGLEHPDPVDETMDADGAPRPRGRCDTCGAPCGEDGCTVDQGHEVAID